MKIYVKMLSPSYRHNNKGRKEIAGRRRILGEAQLQKEIDDLLESIAEERSRKKKKIDESEFEETGSSEEVSSDEDYSTLQTSTTTLPKMVENNSPNITISSEDVQDNVDRLSFICPALWFRLYSTCKEI